MTLTEEQSLELGKRAVAAGFRSMAGMLAISGERAGTVLHGRARWCPQHDDARSVWDKLRDDDIPDFRDPATLGILRAQVVALVPRAAETVVMRWFGATIGATVRWCAAGGGWIGPEHWAHGVGDNWPVEALVACLEAAKKGEL